LPLEALSLSRHPKSPKRRTRHDPDIEELRTQCEAFVAQMATRADALAARRLDVDDEQDASSEMPALPMPAAARVTQPSGFAAPLDGGKPEACPDEL
jgi:hypothetical protein